MDQPICLYLTVIEDDDAVAHLAHLLHDMGGENNGERRAVIGYG